MAEDIRKPQEDTIETRTQPEKEKVNTREKSAVPTFFQLEPVEKPVVDTPTLTEQVDVINKALAASKVSTRLSVEKTSKKQQFLRVKDGDQPTAKTIFSVEFTDKPGETGTSRPRVYGDAADVVRAVDRIDKAGQRNREKLAQVEKKNGQDPDEEDISQLRKVLFAGNDSFFDFADNVNEAARQASIERTESGKEAAAADKREKTIDNAKEAAAAAGGEEPTNPETTPAEDAAKQAEVIAEKLGQSGDSALGQILDSLKGNPAVAEAVQKSVEQLLQKVLTGEASPNVLVIFINELNINIGNTEVAKSDDKREQPAPGQPATVVNNYYGGGYAPGAPVPGGYYNAGPGYPPPYPTYDRQPAPAYPPYAPYDNRYPAPAPYPTPYPGDRGSYPAGHPDVGSIVATELKNQLPDAIAAALAKHGLGQPETSKKPGQLTEADVQKMLEQAAAQAAGQKPEAKPASEEKTAEITQASIDAAVAKATSAMAEQFNKQLEMLAQRMDADRKAFAQALEKIMADQSAKPEVKKSTDEAVNEAAKSKMRARIEAMTPEQAKARSNELTEQIKQIETQIEAKQGDLKAAMQRRDELINRRNELIKGTSTEALLRREQQIADLQEVTESLNPDSQLPHPVVAYLLSTGKSPAEINGMELRDILSAIQNLPGNKEQLTNLTKQRMLQLQQLSNADGKGLSFLGTLNFNGEALSQEKLAQLSPEQLEATLKENYDRMVTAYKQGPGTPGGMSPELESNIIAIGQLIDTISGDEIKAMGRALEKRVTENPSETFSQYQEELTSIVVEQKRQLALNKMESEASRAELSSLNAQIDAANREVTKIQDELDGLIDQKGEVVTELTTIAELHGELADGAPTSPELANMTNEQLLARFKELKDAIEAWEKALKEQIELQNHQTTLGEINLDAIKTFFGDKLPEGILLPENADQGLSLAIIVAYLKGVGENAPDGWDDAKKARYASLLAYIEGLENSNNLLLFADNDPHPDANGNPTNINFIIINNINQNQQNLDQLTQTHGDIDALRGNLNAAQAEMTKRNLSPEEEKKAEPAKSAEVAAELAQFEANIKGLELGLEQSDKPKNWLRKAAEFAVTLVGARLSRNIVRGVVVGVFGAAAGPLGIVGAVALASAAGALGGAVAKGFFGSYLHYELFNKDKPWAVWAEHSKPGGKWSPFKNKTRENLINDLGLVNNIKALSGMNNALAQINYTDPNAYTFTKGADGKEMLPSGISREQIIAAYMQMHRLQQLTNFSNLDLINAGVTFNNREGNAVASQTEAIKGLNTTLRAILSANNITDAELKEAVDKMNGEVAAARTNGRKSVTRMKMAKGALMGGAFAGVMELFQNVDLGNVNVFGIGKVEVNGNLEDHQERLEAQWKAIGGAANEVHAEAGDMEARADDLLKLSQQMQANGANAFEAQQVQLWAQEAKVIGLNSDGFAEELKDNATKLKDALDQAGLNQVGQLEDDLRANLGQVHGLLVTESTNAENLADRIDSYVDTHPAMVGLDDLKAISEDLHQDAADLAREATDLENIVAGVGVEEAVDAAAAGAQEAAEQGGEVVAVGGVDVEGMSAEQIAAEIEAHKETANQLTVVVAEAQRGLEETNDKLEDLLEQQKTLFEAIGDPDEVAHDQMDLLKGMGLDVSPDQFAEAAGSDGFISSQEEANELAGLLGFEAGSVEIGTEIIPGSGYYEIPSDWEQLMGWSPRWIISEDGSFEDEFGNLVNGGVWGSEIQPDVLNATADALPQELYESELGARVVQQLIREGWDGTTWSGATAEQALEAAKTFATAEQLEILNEVVIGGGSGVGDMPDFTEVISVGEEFLAEAGNADTLDSIRDQIDLLEADASEYTVIINESQTAMTNLLQEITFLEQAGADVDGEGLTGGFFAGVGNAFGRIGDGMNAVALVPGHAAVENTVLGIGLVGLGLGAAYGYSPDPTGTVAGTTATNQPAKPGVLKRGLDAAKAKLSGNKPAEQPASPAGPASPTGPAAPGLATGTQPPAGPAAPTGPAAAGAPASVAAGRVTPQEMLGVAPTNPENQTISTDPLTGRFVAPAETWREQSGQLPEYALTWPKVYRMRTLVDSGANWFARSGEMLWFRKGGNPFRDQFYKEVVNNVNVDNKFYVLDIAQNRVQEMSADVSRLRQLDMNRYVAEQFRGLQADMRPHVRGFIQDALEVEFGRGSQTGLTPAQGLERLHPEDKQAVELFMRDRNVKVNDEMVDAFLDLMIVLNDPNNYDANSQQLNGNGTAQFNGLVQGMLDRENNWKAVSAKGLVTKSSRYRGMPLVVSDAIIRSALEMSGYQIDPQMRASGQYLTNIDQLTRAAGVLDSRGGLYNGLVAINQGIVRRGQRRGPQAPRGPQQPPAPTQRDRTIPARPLPTTNTAAAPVPPMAAPLVPPQPPQAAQVPPLVPPTATPLVPPVYRTPQEQPPTPTPEQLLQNQVREPGRDTIVLDRYNGVTRSIEEVQDLGRGEFATFGTQEDAARFMSDFGIGQDQMKVIANGQIKVKMPAQLVPAQQQPPQP